MGKWDDRLPGDYNERNLEKTDRMIQRQAPLSFEVKGLSGCTLRVSWKCAADDAARRASLPPKPATLAERMGRPDTRWNGKWYGRDSLCVYLDGAAVQVPADVKTAWDREWTEYKAARKAAGIN